MTAKTSRLRANRVRIQLETYYSYDRVEGVGVLANISYSGALVEETRKQPAVGTPIVLYLCLDPPSAFEAHSPFELVGRVVRHSPSGFAVQYPEGVDPALRQMVDHAAAVVAKRH
jgi:PilZ domain